MGETIPPVFHKGGEDMTIQEAMDRVDEMKPNKQSQTLKVRWLSELDGIIWRELEKTHRGAYGTPGERPPWENEDGSIDPYWNIQEGSGNSTQPAEESEFTGYDNITDWETELKAPFPYDEIYPFWLMVKIDLQNMEWDKYENDRQLFNGAWANLSSWWTRTHMPNQGRRHFAL